jgi:hypothetical protein
MYVFYFDECGNPSMSNASIKTDPWFVLAAAALHDSEWRAIDSRLTEIKQRFFPTVAPDKVEIKSTNIRSWGGPYPRWPFSELSKAEIDELVNAAYSIFGEFDITLFFAIIHKGEHKARYGDTARHPYELAFEFLVERTDFFLDEKGGQIGFLILDEQPGQERVVISRQLWYQKRGTWEKKSIDHVKEIPFFSTSRHSQLLTLPDLHAYNVYHRYRYDKPDYPYFRTTLKYTYGPHGVYDGYGLKKFP